MYLAPDGDEIEIADAAADFLAGAMPMARLHGDDPADLGASRLQAHGRDGVVCPCRARSAGRQRALHCRACAVLPRGRPAMRAGRSARAVPGCGHDRRGRAAPGRHVRRNRGCIGYIRRWRLPHPRSGGGGLCAARRARRSQALCAGRGRGRTPSGSRSGEHSSRCETAGRSGRDRRRHRLLATGATRHRRHAGRHGRGGARADRRIRQGARDLRPQDRLVAGGAPPLRRHGGAGRGGARAAVVCRRRA